MRPRTWSFMGSQKWGYKYPNMSYKTVATLPITVPIATHEPPSTFDAIYLGPLVRFRGMGCMFSVHGPNGKPLTLKHAYLKGLLLE